MEITPDASRSQVIETLAGVAETDATYKIQYGQLLEWLSYVGLINMDGETVKIVGVAPATDPVKPDGGAGDTPAAAAESAAEVAPSFTKPTVPLGAMPMVSLSVEISVNAEDLAMLTGEQITALFEGIGKVASVKAELEKN